MECNCDVEIVRMNLVGIHWPGIDLRESYILIPFDVIPQKFETVYIFDFPFHQAALNLKCAQEPETGLILNPERKNLKLKKIL